MNPLVVVQILLYNEPFDGIDRLLASLEAVDYPLGRWKVVIVNNQCAGFDIAGHFEKKWRAKVGVSLPETVFQVQKNNGFAGGHNSAHAISKTFHPEYIYLLNGDAHVDHQFLWRVVQAAEAHPNAALVQSRILLDQDREKINSIGNALHFLGFGFSKTTDESSLPTFYASGAGVLIRTAMLHGRMFDDGYFMYHDDVDLGWRARLAGHDIVIANDSVIYHHYEFSRSIKKFYWMERNRHLTNLANYKLGTLILIAPAAIIMEFGTLIFAIKGGWAKEKVRSWLHFFKPSTWRWIFRTRYEVAGLRNVTDRVILSKMVGVIENQETNNPFVLYLVNPLMSLYLVILRTLVRW